MRAVPEPTLALALEHHRSGRLAEAERLYRAILHTDPEHPDALHLSGLLADARGEFPRAIALIRQALAHRPHPSFHFSLATALAHIGRHAEAAEHFQQAIALGMPGPDPHHHLAIACNALGRWPEAAAAATAAIGAMPPSPILDPGPNPGANPGANPGPWHQLAIARHHEGRMEDTIAACQAALAASPPHPETLTYLGDALRRLGRLHESEIALRHVLALLPDDFAAHNNLALTLEGRACWEEALALLERAAHLEPGGHVSRYNRGMNRLRQGNLAEGWPDYESRIHLDPTDHTYAAFAHRPQWHGEPLEGRSILLTAEQGAGDAIMFARYAPLLRARGATVTLTVQPALIPLLQTLPGNPSLVPLGTPPPDTDFQCPLLSLPLAFGTTLRTIPADTPYLQPDPARARSWATRLALHTGLRAGIVWAGNPHHNRDRQRSIPFQALAPLFAIPGVTWFSLQVGPRAAEAEANPALHILGPALSDFAETAAAIRALDLVIAVDTSCAHVAGALAARTWLLLPHVADWRWLTSRSTSPWYPTMRLFRQGADASWFPVIAEAAAELRVLAATATPRAGS